MMNASTKQMLIALALLVVAGGSGGCATIVSGTTEKIEFTSEPAGALVTIEGKSAPTPATFILERKQDHVATVQYAGYHPSRLVIEKHFNPMTIGNAAFGGLVGVGVDAVSGASNELKPKNPHVILTPLRPGESAREQVWYSEDQLDRKDEIDKKLHHNGEDAQPTAPAARATRDEAIARADAQASAR